jgi:predicted house-cleaning noncanonical NTP pyrophosphatase (MazG superfamily)
MNENKSAAVESLHIDIAEMIFFTFGAQMAQIVDAQRVIAGLEAKLSEELNEYLADHSDDKSPKRFSIGKGRQSK